MKKQVKSRFGQVRKAILYFGILSAFCFNVSPVKAQDSVAPVTIDVRYIGMMDEDPVIQLVLHNENSTNFVLSISDDDGNVLYTEKLSSRKFVKRFKLENARFEKVKLNFIVWNRKYREKEVFEIDTNTRTYSDVVVTRL